MTVFNPRLYEALRRRFGDVKVANRGQPAQISRPPNWSRQGRLTTTVKGGEYYRINCPGCGDRRQRLYISYLWGQRDPKTGQYLNHLTTCFNERCTQSDPQLLTDAFRFGIAPQDPSLFGLAGDSGASPGPVLPGAGKLIKQRLPQGPIPITNEHVPNDVGDYLRQRGFVLRELWDRWRIKYCRCSTDPAPIVHNRIVIPIYAFSPTGQNAFLAGWQARRIGDPLNARTPKYLTSAGMAKSELLYGLPAALKTRGPVAVCEGVTDVWRLGGNAVALLGKSLSVRQCALLAQHFAGRPLVMLLDSDAQQDAGELARQLRARRRNVQDRAPVVIAALPAGVADPGAATRAGLWEGVARALEISPQRLARAMAMSAK